MCGGGLCRDDVGFRGFIAGRFVEFGNEPLFRGRWSEAQLGGFSAGLWQLEPRPWWRAPWHTFYTPWYYRGALIVLFLYLLWRVAGWLDRRQGKTG